MSHPHVRSTHQRCRKKPIYILPLLCLHLVVASMCWWSDDLTRECFSFKEMYLKMSVQQYPLIPFRFPNNWLTLSQDQAYVLAQYWPHSCSISYQWVRTRKMLTPVFLQWSYIFLALTTQYAYIKIAAYCVVLNLYLVNLSGLITTESITSLTFAQSSTWWLICHQSMYEIKPNFRFWFHD